MIRDPRPTRAWNILGSTARALAPSGVLSVVEGTPAQEVLALLGYDLLEDLHAELLLGRVGRGEERADAIRSRLSQGDAQRLAAGDEELVGNLDQDPRTIAGVVLAAAGATVIQVHKRRQSIPDQLMRFPPLQVDDEPHPATVMFVARIIQALRRW